MSEGEIKRRNNQKNAIQFVDYVLLSEGVVIDNTQLFNEKLKEWENFYNYNRPHAALGSQTPYERFREKAKLCV